MKKIIYLLIAVFLLSAAALQAQIKMSDIIVSEASTDIVEHELNKEYELKKFLVEDEYGHFRVSLPEHEKRQLDYLIGFSLIALSGVFDGIVETLDHHYYLFEGKFPDANPNYWNKGVSWKNKWKNGNPEDGEKFPGSSTIFVSLTDGYHLFRTLDYLALSGGSLFVFRGNKEWWVYAIEFVAMSIVRHGVFTFVHDHYFRP